MSKRNLNKVTRANILAHIEVNAAVEDIRTLYGAAGVNLAETLVAQGYATKGVRNGFAVYHAIKIAA